MYRATELWRREIQESNEWRNKSDYYLEIKYENLILNTEKVLRELCMFLNVDFSIEMLELKKPSEKYGVHSRKLDISKTSIAKYGSETSMWIKRIEEIAYPMMKQLGYNIKFAKSHKPFSSIKMPIVKVMDFIKFKVNVKRKRY